MDYNQLTIDLSARTDAQAINLGFAVAKRYWWLLLLAYCMAILPFFVIGLLLLGLFESTWVVFWSGMIIWWFKPYYERVVLFNVSRLIFNQSIGFSGLLDSLVQATKNDLWLNLTLYRLSLARSATMPVKLLEGLSSNEYAERVKSLRLGGAGSSLTVGLLHIELVIYVNCYLLLTWLLPDYWLSDVFEVFSEDGRNLLSEILNILFYSIAMALVGVFYTCAGFLLYLNRRIMNEGWSIEMAFKQMAKRLKSMQQTMFMLLAAFIMVPVMIEPAVAQTGAPDNTNKAQFVDDFAEDRAILSEIILDEEVNPFEIKGEWVSTSEKKESRKSNDSNWFDGLGFEWFAGFLRFILIVGTIFLLVWLVVRYKDKWLQLFGKSPQLETYKAPEVMFGLNVTKAALPEDIASDATQLLQAGDAIGALSLLYRGSLVSLICDYEILIKESHTEGDCLRLAKPHLTAGAFSYFSRLTHVWQTLVYAHQAPDDKAIEDLIRHWGDNFESHREVTYAHS